MYHRDNFGDAFAGGYGAIAVLITLITAWLIFKAVVGIVRTFKRYSSTHKSLWISLAICVALSALGILLSSVLVSASFILLLFVGIAELLLTCAIVSLRNRDTLLREHVSLIAEVLHTPWWGSEDTPRKEQELEQVAA